jgi:hypothetical protein
MITSIVLAGVLAATQCENLKSLSLPDKTIRTAELVPAGSYSPPAPAPPANPDGGRVQGPGATGGPAAGRGRAVRRDRQIWGILLEVQCRGATRGDGRPGDERRGVWSRCDPDTGPSCGGADEERGHADHGDATPPGTLRPCRPRRSG